MRGARRIAYHRWAYLSVKVQTNKIMARVKKKTSSWDPLCQKQCFMNHWTHQSPYKRRHYVSHKKRQWFGTLILFIVWICGTFIFHRAIDWHGFKSKVLGNRFQSFISSPQIDPLTIPDDISNSMYVKSLIDAIFSHRESFLFYSQNVHFH